MHYRGRHRQVASQRQRRLRHSASIGAVTAATLIAPLAFSGPVVSQAETTAYDTLAKHSEWLLSSADPAVAAQIAKLKATLTERGVPYTDVRAYRVPTVEGFTTYVTARPETMAVRPNPDLLERTPEGAAAVHPMVVLARLLEATAQPAGVGGGSNVPALDILVRAFNDAWEMADVPDIQRIDVWALIDSIKRELDNHVTLDDEQLIADLKATIDDAEVQARRIAAKALYEAAIIIGRLPTSDQLRQAVLDAVGSGFTTAEALKQHALDLIAALDLLGKVSTLINDGTYTAGVLIGQAITLLGSIKEQAEGFDPLVTAQQVEALVTAELDEALLTVGLPKYSDLELSAIVTEVVPLAAAAPPGRHEIMANPNLPDGARDDNDGSSANWSTRNKDCYNIATDAFWRLVCWRIDGQDKDNDSSRNFWQFHVDASGKSLRYRKMERMWIEAKPAPRDATNQGWDALAKPSAEYGGSDGCSTTGENISVASGAPVQVGFGWYWERTTCETYFPKSYGDDGHWASVWEGNPNVKPDVHRAVMVKVPVKTPADKGVMWELLTGQRTD